MNDKVGGGIKGNVVNLMFLADADLWRMHR